MTKTLKYLSLGLLIYFSLNLICSHSQFLLNRSIANQANYIHNRLVNGADYQLQERYPEGFIFSNCIFALSLIELNDQKYSRLIDRCILQILSNEATNSFPSNLMLKHGAFYNGWVNYTLKSYIQSDIFIFSSIKQKIEKEHVNLTQEIIDFQSDSIRLAESYTESIWPADNLACISSLPSDQLDLKKKWMNLLKTNTTNKLTLINHDNFDTSITRGSSQALILYFLQNLSPNYGHQSNEIFKNNFIDHRLGISFVKEYLDKGQTDYDSGPIVLDYGSVATIMNIRAQSAYGVKEKITWNLLNLSGLPINIFGEKYYLFKQELMFDIFMLWTSISLKD